jgi:hypothetical protein
LQKSDPESVALSPELQARNQAFKYYNKLS